jgi:hypothetical protein
LGLIAQNISLDTPFISAGDVRVIKASKKMTLFNAKIVRSQWWLLQKVFSNDDLDP